MQQHLCVCAIVFKNFVLNFMKKVATAEREKKKGVTDPSRLSSLFSIRIYLFQCWQSSLATSRNYSRSRVFLEHSSHGLLVALESVAKIPTRSRAPIATQ